MLIPIDTAITLGLIGFFSGVGVGVLLYPLTHRAPVDDEPYLDDTAPITDPLDTYRREVPLTDNMGELSPEREAQLAAHLGVRFTDACEVLVLKPQADRREFCQRLGIEP